MLPKDAYQNLYSGIPIIMRQSSYSEIVIPITVAISTSLSQSPRAYGQWRRYILFAFGWTASVM